MRKSVSVALSAVAVSFAVFAVSIARAQDPPNSQSMPGINTSGHDMSGHPLAKTPAAEPSGANVPGTDSEGGGHAMRAMEGHMDRGPHMKMTALRDLRPGDEERAQKVVEAARHVVEKYKDYHTALNDGFQIFLPKVPQKMYHFTNYSYAFDAALDFHPDRPTSLLYEKHGGGYKLVGVMYTAPKHFTEADLDQRIPLSIARWHEHVNLCMPPAERKREAFGPNPKFGFRGSIATKEACEANGGSFRPLMFNWMVHLYPLEKTEAAIWDVTRGRDHNHRD
jgi:hypothetical protein